MASGAPSHGRRAPLDPPGKGEAMIGFPDVASTDSFDRTQKPNCVDSQAVYVSAESSRQVSEVPDALVPPSTTSGVNVSGGPPSSCTQSRESIVSAPPCP